ncbi:MAG: nucleotidyltransferase family protein [Candidatus Riflebacteria bacterium]|nr:nucleotidyltransferase family protein [Candidatus Riflebacteria bacterium]
MLIPHQIQLLLSLSRFDSTPYSSSDSGEVSKIKPEEWEELANLSRTLGIGSYFFHCLKTKHLLKFLPENTAKSLHHIYLLTAAGNSNRYSEIQLLAKALNQEGIPIILLKGIHLAKWLYKNIAIREMCDIDILVPEKKAIRAFEIARSIGYEIVCEETAHLPTLKNRSTNVVLEIHHSLNGVYERTFFDENELWKHSVLLDSESENVYGLELEDLLIHLCIHLVYRHFLHVHGLKAFCDIVQITNNRENSFSWEKFLQRVREMGCERGVGLCLKLGKNLMGVKVPEHVEQTLGMAMIPEAIYSSSLQQVFIPEKNLLRNFPRLVLVFLGFDSLRSRLKFLKKRFFPKKFIVSTDSLNNPEEKKYFEFLTNRIKIFYFTLLDCFRNASEMRKFASDFISFIRYLYKDCPKKAKVQSPPTSLEIKE